VRILFVMLNGGYVRNYEGVLRQLAAEGHEVHLAIEHDRNKMNENSFSQRLTEESPRITVGLAAVPEPNYWSSASNTGRLLVDYFRYLDPRYKGATALRDRAQWVVPKTYQGFSRFVSSLGSVPAAAAVWALLKAERAVPLCDAVTTFLQERTPDVLLLTPLVEPGSIQVDYIKCARALGIPSALCVASWDNLTNKGLMRLPPDQVFVWNQFQRDEAVELHGVPPRDVVVTGAQIFDHWFDWRPSRTREQFCSTVGLDPAKPFVLFLGSSYFIAPNEAEFGEHWISAIRRSTDPVVADSGILIRPHPSSGSRAQWHGLDLSVWHHTAIWPPKGIDMAAPEFRHDFFDSLYYSAAVVGVNTSAQIEAAIVGKVVCTVEVADFAHSQAGTLHYQHLVKGGLLQVAHSLPEHVEQLGAVIRDPDAQEERSRRFVDAAVRPFGRAEAATPRLAAAILALGATRPAPAVAGTGVRVARVLLLPLAKYVAWLPYRRAWFTYVLIRPIFWIVVPIWTIPYHAHTGYVVVRDYLSIVLGRWRLLASRRLASDVKEGRKVARRQFKTVTKRTIELGRLVARKIVRSGRRGIYLAKRAARTIVGPDRTGQP
jgi:hypothetical protein